MMNKYKAIFFDWDGTAVESRTAPTNNIVPAMIRALEKGIKLIIISGTTYENIANGKLHELIPQNLLKNLFLGLGRGAYNYGFNESGELIVLSNNMPSKKEKKEIHKICYNVHEYLIENYDYETDIVFSRPNYSKIDLLVNLNRKESLFLQAGEIDIVSENLKSHNYTKGIKGLVDLVEEIGKSFDVKIKATTDAKYLEVGMSTKSDNIDYFIENQIFNNGISIEECCFFGDEFTYIEEGIKGSDAYMITDKSMGGSFFDVCKEKLNIPEEVEYIGGGINSFLEFLKSVE